MQNLIFNHPRRSSNSLCYDFKDISRKTWNFLGNAYHNNFSIGEETITDVNLLELKMRQPWAVYTKKFSRPEEGRNGADWAWIIVGRTGTTFILYVQAKKLFLPSFRYESLIHRENPTEQLDKLISNKFFFPHGFPVYPLYVFYNYLPDSPHSIGCNCGAPLPIEYSGCSYADAFSIRDLVARGRNHYNELAPYQYALPCLVCCNSSDKDIREPDLATAFYNAIVDEQTIVEEFNKGAASEISTEDFSAKNLLMSQPPGFVSELIETADLKINPFKELDIENIVVLKETVKS